jgi:hypothetical protein
MLKRTLAALAVAAFPCLSQAMLPDSGWYWNPSQSGMGYEIEIQDNVLFMSVFMYGDDGHPIWIVTGGPMSSDHFYSGSAIQTDNGWCLGCAYKTPTVVPYGPVTVNFTGPATATVTIKGVAIDIVRQQFGFDFSNPATPLLGEWAFVYGAKTFPVYFGQRITLPTTKMLSTGLTATGNMTGEFGTSNAAVGFYDVDTGKWAILLDSSPSYYSLFVLDFAAFNRLEGDVYTYLKGSDPTTSLPVIGNRIRSAIAAAGGSAPGTDKAHPVSVRGDSDLGPELAAQTRAGRSANAEVLGIASRLEAAIGNR